ncbi:MAG: DUF1648 domain-containing protein [Verrucomicrobiales bacterium]|nr:DUF1648 domain-containing protein [Verrucomicrobiales bacterium]
MTTNRTLLSARIVMVSFFALTIGFLCFTYWAHTQLPERVPVHFDGAGKPDRFSSKVELTAVNAGVAVLMLILFGLLPFFLEKIPPRFWNLPHRDYWLAPERVKDTVARINVFYVGMGIATLLLMWFILWGAYQVGSGARDALPFSWWGIGIYLAVIASMCIGLFRAFSLPKEN